MKVPFTPAHAAAALPFRRFRLVTSALVVGTFAPDFEYFIRLAPRGGFGHTLLGAFVLSLPLALLVLWIFHAFVKRPLTSLMPNGIQDRLASYLDKFRLFGSRRFAWIVISILLGIATHIFWDSFTHPTMWLYRHWSFLRQTLRLPMVGPVLYYQLFQHSSTILGLGILGAWLLHWYRATVSGDQSRIGRLSRAHRLFITAVIATIALLGAAIRAIVGVGPPFHHGALEGFVGVAVCTFIALTWWQLVAYGLFSALRKSSKAKAPARMR